MGCLADPTTAELALKLRDALGLRVCIETGTRHGNSTAWAAAHFERVVTIEIDIRAQDNAMRKHAALDNVQWLLGDSRGVLPDVVAHLTRPALFWLDAHDADACPVLDELHAIAASPLQHCIIIDDAASFTRPAPAGISNWPAWEEIAGGARDMGYLFFVMRDLLLLVPVHVGSLVIQMKREANNAV